MSVYQVEEYYVSAKIPEEKLSKVKDWLNNYEHIGIDVNICSDNYLVADNFDSEQYASEFDDALSEVVED